MKKLFLAAIALLAFCVPANNTIWKRFFSRHTPIVQEQLAPEWQRLRDQYEAFVRRSMSDEAIPGVAVAIVKGDTPVLLKGFGVKQAKTSDSVSVHTVFRLASLSKGFAPVLASILKQEEKLDWDDRIIDYVPDFEVNSKEHTQNMSIRHILSHTSGLPRHAYSNLLNQGWYYDEILPKLKRVKPTHPLGVYYNYQNVVYSLIGDVIKEATDTSYAELLEKRIFEPAGMYDATATFDGILETPNVALPHWYFRGKGYDAIEIARNYYEVIPAAGVNASIADMACWLQVLMGNRPDIISQEQLDDIFQPHVEVNLREMRDWNGSLRRAWYALGWRVLDMHDRTIIYHGGFVNGYRTEIAFDPKDKVGIVVLSNAMSNFIGQSAPHFFDLYREMMKDPS